MGSFPITQADVPVRIEAAVERTCGLSRPINAQWLAALRRDVKHYQARLSAFRAILSRYRSRSDGHVFAVTNLLIQQVDSGSSKFINDEAPKLLSHSGSDVDRDRSVPG